MEGALYGAIIGVFLVVVATLAGIRPARGRALAFNLLLLVVYFVSDLVLRAAGVDPFWSVVIALGLLVALSSGLRRLRPTSFAS